LGKSESQLAYGGSIASRKKSNQLVLGGDMEYTVVEEHNRDELIKKVADLIKQGWKPLGGVAVSTVAPVMGIHIFCQALIREHP
jgi:hypothetical protein